MKLRSAFFVLVLLLLTATVCAAQSPMGFSPEEFYKDFKKVNNQVVEGPECSFVTGVEGKGAFINVSESIFFLMIYEGNDVIKAYLLLNAETDDEKSWNDAYGLLYSAVITLAYESGASLDTFDFDELQSLIFDLFIYNKSPVEYWGYLFESSSKEEGNYSTISMRITKAQ